MFDELLGISKQNFLKKSVIPANDNDVFNDNKCTFCWGPYDQDHPAVRVLPCNHVFGHDCLLEMTNAPNGDNCPICRTSLFRPSISVALGRLLMNYVEHLFHLMLLSYHEILVLWNALPSWLKVPILFWVNINNVYYYAQQMVSHCTNMRERNPYFSLNVTMARSIEGILSSPLWMLRDYFHDQDCTGGDLVLSILIVAGLSLAGFHGQFSNQRDHVVFIFIMITALFLKHYTVVFFDADSTCPGSRYGTLLKLVFRH